MQNTISTKPLPHMSAGRTQLVFSPLVPSLAIRSRPVPSGIRQARHFSTNLHPHANYPRRPFYVKAAARCTMLSRSASTPTRTGISSGGALSIRHQKFDINPVASLTRNYASAAGLATRMSLKLLRY